MLTMIHQGVKFVTTRIYIQMRNFHSTDVFSDPLLFCQLQVHFGCRFNQKPLFALESVSSYPVKNLIQNLKLISHNIKKRNCAKLALV